MSTIREVSRRARVSPSTVSRVLNGTVPVSETIKRRVLEAVEALNYQPNTFARGLVTNRSGGVGVAINELTSPFYGAIVRGIEAVIEDAGMHLLVSSGHAEAKREREAIEFLRQRRSDALIVQVEALDDEALLEWARDETPLVIIGRLVPELAGRCIHLDNEKGGFLATQHLIDSGHKHIAHITGPLSMQDSRARLQGYRRALEAAGLRYDERFVVESDYQEEGGQQATKRLLARRLDMSAIFVGNDQMAAGALHVLREEGLRVPEDISLVGYDDVLFARYLYPSLTTVRQPLVEMGCAAAHLALAALAEKETEVKRKFEPELVIRHSVRRLE